jgi:hypothetical protein
MMRLVAEDLRGFAARALKVPDDSITLRPVAEQSEIGQKGVSGAPVYLAFGQDGKLAAVVKVFPPDQAGEMFAMQKLDALQGEEFRTVRAMDASASATRRAKPRWRRRARRPSSPP